MPVYRRRRRWDFRPAHCEGTYGARHRSAMQEPQSPRMQRLAPGPLPSPRCPVGTSHRRGGGNLAPGTFAGIRSSGAGNRSFRRNAVGLLSPRQAMGRMLPHIPISPRQSDRSGAMEPSASRKPISYRSPIPFPQFLHSLVIRRQKSGGKLLARSLELCKCSCDRTVRLSNLRERPVSPDAFHTPVRLARLTRAETEGWGLIEPE